MSTRRVMTWLIFWCSVVLALGALAWVSVEVVALEKRDALAQLDAHRQESIRRALWRMDSRMAPILAIEASRPFTDYQSIEDDRLRWLRGAGAGQNASVQNFNSNYSYANSYFEFVQTEQPLGNQVAVQAGAQARIRIQTADQTTEQIAMIINSGQLSASSLSPNSSTGFVIPQADKMLDQGNVAIESDFQSISTELSQEAIVRKEQTDSDFEARKRVAQIATQTVPQDDSIELAEKQKRFLKDELKENISTDGLSDAFLADRRGDEVAESKAAVRLGASSSHQTQMGVGGSSSQSLGTLYPRWIADDAGVMQLVLVRHVFINQRPVVQGVWLDWMALQTELLDAIADVMPGASLAAVTGPRSAMIGGYQLATIPVEFIPPPSLTVVSWRWSPATIGLLVTWVAILSTIIAVGVVLRAAIVLSERRGRFVSAVTHELRTPLTTFRLYSQMLADGMVSDEQVRKDYLFTLKRESERLTGIVENVLEYARLTRHRSTKDKAAGVQTLSPGALIARFRPALARRAGQSNLDLVVSMDLDEHQSRTLTADPHAVERIMMNLVENACKYASPCEDDETPIEEIDTRIHLDITIADGMLELLVADHGQGIAQGEGARIFGEFQRGWRGLTNARSGLGLGLALSRGLAREMGGDLVLTKRRGHGAEFLLTIPLDT